MKQNYKNNNKTYSKLFSFKKILLLYIIYDNNIYKNNKPLQGGLNTQ